MNKSLKAKILDSLNIMNFSGGQIDHQKVYVPEVAKFNLQHLGGRDNHVLGRCIRRILLVK